MWKHYFTALAATATTLVIAAFCLGIYVNPYYLFGDGGPSTKPAAYSQAIMAKTHLLQRRQPRTLIIGNSRAEIGIDPSSPLWPRDVRPVFNASLAGRELSEARKMLERALQNGPPKLVVVELDFPDFVSEANLNRTRTAEKPSNEGMLQQIKDTATATLTIDAILDSFRTLFNPSPQTSETMTPEGFNPLKSYIAVLAEEGYHSVFAQKQRVYKASLETWKIRGMGDPSRNAELDELHRIVDLCTANHIRTVLFIPPYHAEYLELIRDEGFWPGFQQWKKEVARLSRDDEVRILDFSGYDKFTTETVPAAGDLRTPMRWYWESGHFKSQLGERIIPRLFGDGWGALLDQQSADENNQRIENERQAFLKKQSIGEVSQ
jgi:hypothetical protein